MENEFPQFSPILEIVDHTIRTQSYPGNNGSYDSYVSPILEIVDGTIHICSYVDVAGGRRGGRRGPPGGRRTDGDGDGDGDGGGDDVQTTLPSGQSPGPSRPGTKYPVRGQSLTSTKVPVIFCMRRDNHASSIPRELT